jgi:hypothetical protein
MDTRHKGRCAQGWMSAVTTLAAIAAAASSAAAADIFYAQDLKAILVDGAINRGDLERMEKVSESATGPLEGVYLNSPGGDFITAIEIGYWVREHHLATYASTLMCESACGFLWLAGERLFANGIVSLHMPFYRTSFVTIAIPQEGIADAAWYLASLDYDRRLLDALLVVSFTESNEVFPITGPNTAMYQLSYQHFPHEDLFKEALRANRTAEVGQTSSGP